MRLLFVAQILFLVGVLLSRSHNNMRSFGLSVSDHTVKAFTFPRRTEPQTSEQDSNHRYMPGAVLVVPKCPPDRRVQINGNNSVICRQNESDVLLAEGCQKECK